MPKQINNDIESKFSQILKCTQWKSRDGIVQKGYTVRLLLDCCLTNVSQFDLQLYIYYWFGVCYFNTVIYCWMNSVAFYGNNLRRIILTKQKATSFEKKIASVFIKSFYDSKIISPQDHSNINRQVNRDHQKS